MKNNLENAGNKFNNFAIKHGAVPEMDAIVSGNCKLVIFNIDIIFASFFVLYFPSRLV